MNHTINASSSSENPTLNTHIKTKVILVRHGRTTYNEQGRYQGSSDESVLTKKGHLDAYATGIALQKYNFDAIYTSPLTRVRQTTEEIVTAIARSQDKIPAIFIEPKLTEVCMADWQGLLYQEVKEKYPDAYSCWQNTPHLFTRNQINYPVLELFKQAKKFWQEVLDKHRGQTILIVAHGGTNRALIGTAIALNPKHYHSLQQSNCGISYLEFPRCNDNLAQLKYLNITDHLAEKLPKLKAGKTGWRWLLLSNKVAKDRLKSSYLAKLLQQGSIDFTLTDNSLESESLAVELLKINAKTLHLSTNKDNFLDIWRKTITKRQTAKYNAEKSKLFTGLIIASDELCSEAMPLGLSRILHQNIEMDTSLNLNSNLAVVHYPHLERRSILQGILPLNCN